MDPSERRRSFSPYLEDQDVRSADGGASPSGKRRQPRSRPAVVEAHAVLRDAPVDASARLFSHLRVLFAISDGVAVISEAGRIVLTNPSLDAILGYEAGELSGQSIAVLVGEAAADGESRFSTRIFRALRKRGLWQGDSLTLRKAREPLWTNTTISPYDVPDYGPIWIAIVRDISERKALESDLKHSKEQLELAMRGSSLGMWSVDMHSGEMACDARVFEIFGLPPVPGDMTRERWVNAVHPDDMEYAAAVFRQHLKGDTPIFQIEHRIKHTDGHYVWVLASGKVMHRTAEGWATRVIGTCQDVSIQKRLKQETENLLVRLETILAAARGYPVASTEAAARAAAVNQLTRRERAVVTMVAQGMTSAQIAERMHVATGTIGTHRRNLMAKLDLHSTAEVMRFAMENGLFNDSEQGR